MVSHLPRDPEAVPALPALQGNTLPEVVKFRALGQKRGRVQRLTKRFFQHFIWFCLFSKKYYAIGHRSNKNHETGDFEQMILDFDDFFQFMGDLNLDIVPDLCSRAPTFCFTSDHHERSNKI